jgi:hypothetical protein
VVLHAWYRHFGDYRATIESVIACGGDADTTGAIAGALAGLTVGGDAIPPEWIHGLRDWPRGVSLLNRLADQLAGGPEGRPVRYIWPAVPFRNLLFLLIALLHALRRLLGLKAQATIPAHDS